MQNRIHLNYLDTFTCLAADCPDDCCHGWNIHLDSAILKKWRDVGDEADRKRLLDPVVRINDGGSPADVIKRRENDTCPNLEASGLCWIQRKYGHDYLPQTCQSYPRVSVENRHTLLETMHLSCPAVATMLVSETQNDLFSFHGQENRPSARAELDIEGLAQAYEQTTRLLLKTGQWPLDQRLVMLAEVLAETAKRAARGELGFKSLHKLSPASEAGINKRMKDLQKRVNSGRLKFNRSLAGRFWFLVLTNSNVLKQYIDSNTAFSEHSLVQHLQQPVEEAGQAREKFLIRLARLQTELHESAQKKAGHYPEQILLNYLTAKFMNHGFPWYPYRNHFILTFLDCMVPYFLVRTLFDLHLQKSGGLASEVAATIIYTVEKAIAHNLSVFDALEEDPELLELDKYAAAWV